MPMTYQTEIKYKFAFQEAPFPAAREHQHKEGGTNSRIHHFLPDRVGIIQSALCHFLVESSFFTQLTSLPMCGFVAQLVENFPPL